MKRSATRLALFSLCLCAACGARSAMDSSDATLAPSPDLSLAADVSASVDLEPCPELAQMVGEYRGEYEGVVNCLEEKYLAKGTLTFSVHVADDGSRELEVDGTLTETFGELLTARIVGRVDCSGRSEIELSSIRVGAVPTSDVKGWLRGFRYAAGGFNGTWRMERYAPLCLAAGAWSARR